MGTFVGQGYIDGVRNILFRNGFMYVGAEYSDKVLRFDPNTGAYIDTFVTAGTAGLDNPSRIAFHGPSNDLFVTSTGNSQIFEYGTQAEVIFDVTLAASTNIQVSVDFSTTDATAFAGSDYVATTGTVEFSPGATRRVVRIPLLDDSSYEANEAFVVPLLNPPAGSSIVDSQGVGTILDNDVPPTKFYVVNDGSPDRTYEYNANGNAVENNALGSGNTSPGGAASNLAGNRVWGGDAN